VSGASLLAAIGNLATHCPKIKSNHAPLRPRREQALMLVALLRLTDSATTRPLFLRLR